MTVLIREAATAEEILRRAGELDEDAVREVLALLEELLDRVRSEIARRPDLTVSDLTALERDLEQAIALYRARLVALLAGYLSSAYDLGDDAVDAMTREAGVAVGTAAVSTRTLEIAQAYVADLITGLTDDARRAITREVRLAALGGRSLAELLRNIGTRLDAPGPFRSIAARAEAIARTEVNRVFALSFRARGDQLAQVVPGLCKRWVHATGTLPRGRLPRGMYRPRPGHVALHGTVIPWAEQFTVSGETAFGPHDPKLSARQSVNCKCRLELVFPDE